MVDAYARFKITDPLLFYQTVRNENGARGRLEAIIDSSVRRALGNETLGSIPLGKEMTLLSVVMKLTSLLSLWALLSMYGCGERITQKPRSEYFQQNEIGAHEEAKEFRATGEEELKKWSALKTRTVIISEAQQSRKRLGAGDSEAIRIYADSFGQDAGVRFLQIDGGISKILW